MAKVKIDDRPCTSAAKRAAEVAGYSSVEEFIADSIEKAIQRLKVDEREGQVSDQFAAWDTSNDRSARPDRRLAERRGECLREALAGPGLASSCRGGCPPRSSRR